MATQPPARQAAQQEQDQGGWLQTLLRAAMVFIVINAATSFLGGKLGAQKNVTGQAGGAKPANPGPERIPALWSLGTNMVNTKGAEVTLLGYENLSG